MHVQKAIAALPGVAQVDVILSSEKAIVQVDSSRVAMTDIQQAVESAGYRVGRPEPFPTDRTPENFSRPLRLLLGFLFATVLLVVIVGEWLGLFELLNQAIPLLIGVAIVIAAGYPIFFKVIRAAWHRQVISHTLMTVGVLAALAVGQWVTAVVVVFFMRVGDYVERFTAERARRAVKDLAALAPQTARVEMDGREAEIPAGQVLPGQIVVVRPGEWIPVDGQVVGGQATVNQANITGESLPVEAGPGAPVFAATLVSLGSLRIEATQVGGETTFGRIIHLVEEAEARRADVQRIADKFSAYYLPVVSGIALLTWLVRGDPLAAAAVLVVACSCAFALATPIAMLASIGAGAKHGLLIKGGKYLESLDKANVLLIDKTGTLTLGKPEVTEILLWDEDAQFSREEVLLWAASAERYSEHPLAEAVRQAARRKETDLLEPQNFQATPGLGVNAMVGDRKVTVGSQRFLEELNGAMRLPPAVADLQAEGKSLIYVAVDGRIAGCLAATDTLRTEVPQAIAEVRRLGIRQVELLTGDNEQTAASLAARLGLPFRANLLPEDKIRIVQEYQAQGKMVVMIGDGVNDAPALAQADVGIAMGAAGSDVAIEAAHIALLRDDWRLVPDVLRIARRTMKIVRGNIAFTAVYNLVGITLAAVGILPPIWAAAAQSLPDLGILANSSRLLKQAGLPDDKR
jgi:Cd2+/Zn2+-exporting ATPase/Cu+-exporting ATPase